MAVWAVDSSTVSHPQTESLRKHFGGATNQSENAYNVTWESDSTDMVNLWYPSYRSLKRLRTTGIEINREYSHQNTHGEGVGRILTNTEVLITNLYDPQIYDMESMKEAYHFRWGIETGYGDIKRSYKWDSSAVSVKIV